VTLSFVRRKSECAIPEQRAPDTPTKLMTVIERRVAFLTEEVAGVERIVTKELKTSPCTTFVQDGVTMLTTDPDLRPYPR
jgi:hypothetical protein